MRDTPQWKPRPTEPGWWLCVPAESSPFQQWEAIELTQRDLDRGAPFHTATVYGPIPPPPDTEY